MYPIEKYQFAKYDKKNPDGSTSKVIVAISTYAGKIVKGFAKCRDTDEYNEEIGKKLAAARCDLKVCVKRKERALRQKTEVAQKIEKLSKYYLDMCEYYDDALDECVESLERVKAIEDSVD